MGKKLPFEPMERVIVTHGKYINLKGIVKGCGFGYPFDWVIVEINRENLLFDHRDITKI